MPNNPQRTEQTSTEKALEGQGKAPGRTLYEVPAVRRTEPAENFGDFDSACIVLAPPAAQRCIPLTIQRGASSRPRLNLSRLIIRTKWLVLAFDFLAVVRVRTGTKLHRVNICDVIGQRNFIPYETGSVPIVTVRSSTQEVIMLTIA